MVFCLSHNSALVKTLSTSLLRQVLALDGQTAPPPTASSAPAWQPLE